MTDANIWIDLHNADLLAAAFELDHTWRTPDVPIHPKGAKGVLGSAEDRAQPEAGTVSWTSSRIGMVEDQVLTINRNRLLELGLDVRTLSGDELNRIPPLNRRDSRSPPIDIAGPLQSSLAEA